MTDPWRFACPSCGSCQLVRRQPGGRRLDDGAAKWRCEVCDRTTNEVYDKKKGYNVCP